MRSEDAERTPMLIDTDMAADDWMALAYAARHPRAELRAVTVAATGEAHAAPGERNARSLLALAGLGGVEVAAGPERPLAGGRAFPGIVRFVMDRHLFVPLPRAAGRASARDGRAGRGGRAAVEAIVRAVEGAEGRLVILAIGPLTTLAAALRERPDLARKIARVVIMGGALEVPGNIRDVLPSSPYAHSEWNTLIDPRAANVVFRSGAPLRLVPLDATNGVPLTAGFIDRLAADPGDPLRDFLVGCLRRMHGLSKGRGFYFWDPLAAALALEPELGRFETMRLRAVEDEGPDLGRVVRDPRGGEVEVCLSAAAGPVEERMLEVLRGAPQP